MQTLKISAYSKRFPPVCAGSCRFLLLEPIIIISRNQAYSVTFPNYSVKSSVCQPVRSHRVVAPQNAFNKVHTKFTAFLLISSSLKANTSITKRSPWYKKQVNYEDNADFKRHYNGAFILWIQNSCFKSICWSIWPFGPNSRFILRYFVVLCR